MALVMEADGLTGDALEAYAAALEVRSDVPARAQGLARLLARERRDDEHLGPLLDEIALKGTDKAWRAWAGGSGRGGGKAEAAAPLSFRAR